MMLEGLIFFVLKSLSVVTTLCILKAIWMEVRVRSVLKRLCAQGMSNYPGNETFMVGP